MRRKGRTGKVIGEGLEVCVGGWLGRRRGGKKNQGQGLV